jgi:hypothetical protein
MAVDARRIRWYIAIRRWRARREGGVRRAAQHAIHGWIAQSRSFTQIMRKRKQA